MRTTLLLAAMAFALPGLADEALIEEGAALYDDFCANCHGADVDGLQNYQGSLEEFRRRLEGETEDMPDFTDYFEPEEVEAMHAFLMDAIG